jgi:hypothetical protein
VQLAFPIQQFDPLPQVHETAFVTHFELLS